jgi:hypothetical protein
VRWLLVALCACNSILGLGDVRDRAAPSDAPFACPPIGTTPQFSPVIHQSSVHVYCNSYERFASRYALGMCQTDPAYSEFVVSESFGDAALVPITTFDGLPTTESIAQAYVSPDGNLMVLSHTIVNAVHIEQYVRVAGSWTYDRDLPIPASFRTELGSIGGEATRWRMLVVEGAFDEWGTADGMWSLLVTHSAATLGVAKVEYASLTEDGLRAVLLATPLDGGAGGIYFTDRPDLASEFRVADRLDTVPATAAPYLDHTCARIYVGGLESVFYAQQL